MEKILEKKEFCFFTLITMVFFGVFIKLEYALDTYSVFANDINSVVYQFCSCGRFITGLAAKIVYMLRFSNENIYILSIILAIICISLSQYKIFKIVKKDIKNNLIAIILSVLVIINIFCIELFLFIEKGIMALSVLMCILAVESVINFFENKNKKDLFKVYLYMTIANFSYQGTVGIFVAFALVYIIKYSKNIIDFIKNNIIVALGYGIPAIIDYVLVRILYTNARVNGEFIFVESFKKIWTSTTNMILSTYSLLPKYFFVTMVLIIYIILIYKILKENVQYKYKILNIMKSIYVILGVIIVTIAPQLMQNTSAIWFVARSTYAFASLPWIITLYLLINYESKFKFENFILVIMLIYVIMQYITFNKISIDRYNLNYIDESIAKKICNNIIEYEKETGTNISKISIYKDKNPQYTYEGIFATGDTNVKAFSTDWSTISILKYYLGEDLVSVEGNEQYREKFSQKDWKDFDENQLIFEGDILHLCLY